MHAMVSPRLRRAVAGIAVAMLLATALSAAVAPSAGAAPTAARQPQCGVNTSVAPTLTPSRTTIGENETATVTVTASNFLVPPHVCGTNVFGGVYLFFGWVKPGGQWGPSWRSSTSATGLFGQTYSYPGEGGGAETRDDGTGTVRLISFTQGGESGDSTPFHMDGSGNWSADLIVRGSKYSFVDVVTGQSASVDCMVVQCGVFTIGAHGKASRTNEQFFPINFTDAKGAVVTPRAPDTGGAGGSANPPASGPIPGAPAMDGGDVGVASTPGGTSDDGTTSGDEAPAVGSVGEAPTDTVAAEVAGESDDADVEDTEEIAAKVQDFGDSDSGGGGSALLLVGILAALVVVIGGGAALVTRRKKAAT